MLDDRFAGKLVLINDPPETISDVPAIVQSQGRQDLGQTFFLHDPSGVKSGQPFHHVRGG